MNSPEKGEPPSTSPSKGTIDTQKPPSTGNGGISTQKWMEMKPDKTSKGKP